MGGSRYQILHNTVDKLEACFDLFPGTLSQCLDVYKTINLEISFVYFCGRNLIVRFIIPEYCHCYTVIV